MTFIFLAAVRDTSPVAGLSVALCERLHELLSGVKSCSSFPHFTPSCFIALTLKVPEQQPDNEDRKVSSHLLCCAFSLAALQSYFYQTVLHHWKRGFIPSAHFVFFSPTPFISLLTATHVQSESFSGLFLPGFPQIFIRSLSVPACLCCEKTVCVFFRL